MADALICESMNSVRQLYAELFGCQERAVTLDPVEDARALANVNKRISELQKEIQEKMPPLTAELDKWRGNRSGYPADVNQIVDEFLELLEQGIRHCLDMIEKRSRELGDRRDALKKNILSARTHRKKMSGYKTSGHSAPRLFKKDV